MRKKRGGGKRDPRAEARECMVKMIELYRKEKLEEGRQSSGAGEV